MKNIVFGITLIIAVIQDVHGFHLTSLKVKEPLTISKEVADSVPLFIGKNAYDVPGATQENLNHLGEYLVRQYQIIQDSKKDSSLAKSKFDKDPKEEWKKYSTETMNEPQLIALTKTAVSIFPDDKPVPRGIVDSWNVIIQRQNYGVGIFIGLFRQIGDDLQDSLGQKIWDEYAKDSGKQTVKEYMNSLKEWFEGGTAIDLDSEKKDESEDNNKPSRWQWNTIKSAISQRWAQMDRGEKVAWIAIPATVFFLWYTLSHRG